ncbi:MAG: BtrH N-terminal domain-containing protein [Candidatus Eremiobacteraeota bacterium]|nr:BtrH N-terminal domain-containing protein [Candidatus Eremiobacteraeota bacterium]
MFNKRSIWTGVIIICICLLLIVSCKPRGGDLPESIQLDVPHIYDGCGELCVLGSLAMLMRAQNPGITYEQVILASGLGGGYGCSLFSGGLPPQSLVFTAIRRMGYRPGMAVGPNPNPVLIFTFLQKLPPDKVDFLEGADEGEEFLKEELALGRPVMVHVDEFFMADRGRPEIRKRRHNPHFMVVTGYDSEHYYLNDPGFCGSAACGIRLSRKEFLKAWKEGGAAGEKFGPYFMLWLEPVRKPVSERALLECLGRDSSVAPFYLRALASRLKRKVGFYEWKRLVHTAPEVLGRRTLASFLAKRGLKNAARLYKQSAEMFEKLKNSKDLEEFSDLLLDIADHEEKASKILNSEIFGDNR